MRGERRLPGERLVDALRPAVVVDQQILGAASESRAARRRSGLPAATCSGLPAGFGPGGRGLRIGRLVAQAARHIDRAEQHLQQMQARQVWKPLEWAEMPRIACIATGRPRIVSWRRPAQSVQGWSSSICLLEGDVGDLGGDAADACRPGCRSVAATASGA